MIEPDTDTASNSEIDPALDPKLDQLSRRTLISRAGAAAGAMTAAVAGVASAQDGDKPKHAIDDPKIKKSDVSYVSTDSNGRTTQFKGFLAQPPLKEGKHHGCVIVIHEIFGLTDHIKDVTCRLAQAGFAALGVNLFMREGEPPATTGGFQPLMDFVNKIPDAQLMSDLKAAGDYLRSLPESNGKVGAVGFCWGGRVSMLLDAADPKIKACVAFYGRISGEPAENQPKHPIDVVSEFHAPLLGNFGAMDTGIPPAEARKLDAALKEHKKTGEIFVYEGAGHAFNNDTRESYNAVAAKEAWGRTVGWFRKYLG